ncbi:sialidase family protein [Lysobacter brunescens]|uniref:Sialidase family protein n=1 Tax=Lysobacter brunescens TaxID=262323 RepID=A0ABW2YDC8_9GAMM
MAYPSAMRTPTLLTVLAFALLAGCAAEVEAPKPVIAGDIAIEAWPLPAMPGTAQPDLSLAPDGRLLLSWISEVPGRRPAFQFAEHLPDRGWQTARTIAVGNSMFVNWADTPHITATPDRALWAHWLQKSADAPYAYDVMLVRSLDHGMNWSAPRKVHDDATTTEHGFVSMWAQDDGLLGVAWLDGRNTGGGAGHEAGQGDGHGGHGDARGPMTLRAAVFDANMADRDAAQIDVDVCDCCQTDVATTRDGALLVYRDRTKDEIRDIYATRFDGKAWSTPKPVHADGWKMPACPVNGPSVAALDRQAVVAWYTGANDEVAVKLAASSDAGATFGKPLVLDKGPEVSGRVAVAIDAKQVWIVWLREVKGAQSLWLARYAPDLSKEIQRTKLADVNGRGRATGMPKLVLDGAVAHVVWTDVVDGTPQLKGVRIVAAAAAPKAPAKAG